MQFLFVDSSRQGGHARKESQRGRRVSNTGPLVVCFGEMMINLVPTVAGMSLADAAAYRKFPAGSTANVAVGISRLGGSSAFIGKVRF